MQFRLMLWHVNYFFKKKKIILETFRITTNSNTHRNSLHHDFEKISNFSVACQSPKKSLTFTHMHACHLIVTIAMT